MLVKDFQEMIKKRRESMAKEKARKIKTIKIKQTNLKKI
jgi:hypothetical protein